MKPTPLPSTVPLFSPNFIAALVSGALLAVGSSAEAGVVVNGYGNGTSWVSGWSGRNPPPGPAYITTTSGPWGFAPTATLNARGNPNAYAATGPDPNGLQSVNTSALATGAPLWSITLGGMGFAGDRVAGDGPALFSKVTPTLYSAVLNLALNGATIVNATTLTFTGSFQGDAGTAASLSFSDIFSPGSSVPLTISNALGAGTLQGDGSLLFLGSGSGNAAQSFSFSVTDPGSVNADYLQNFVQADGEYVIASVPEPSSLALGAMGLLGAAGQRRHRNRSQ